MRRVFRLIKWSTVEKAGAGEGLAVVAPAPGVAWLVGGRSRPLATSANLKSTLNFQNTKYFNREFATEFHASGGADLNDLALHQLHLASGNPKYAMCLLHITLYRWMSASSAEHFQQSLNIFNNRFAIE